MSGLKISKEHIMLPVSFVMDNYKNGDETSWMAEFCWLLHEEGEYMAELVESIDRCGIQEPISLGDDGRIWDGHHRILACRILDIEKIQVSFANEESFEKYKELIAKHWLEGSEQEYDPIEIGVIDA